MIFLWDNVINQLFCSNNLVFDLNGENLTRTVQDLNGMRQKEWWMKHDFEGAISQKIWVLPMPGLSVKKVC